MKFGLIAGNGRFPFLVIEAAKRHGVPLAVAAIKEETDKEIEKLTDILVWLGIGQLENIEYGLQIAGEIARLDLGQTIVVRAKACVAVEAMEGTDATIARAGTLANGKLTVVKVAKPDQDMRFDVPVIGLPTIETMIKAGATCLSVSSGKTLIFDLDAMIELADNHKIAIIGS